MALTSHNEPLQKHLFRYVMLSLLFGQNVYFKNIRFLCVVLRAQVLPPACENHLFRYVIVPPFLRKKLLNKNIHFFYQKKVPAHFVSTMQKAFISLRHVWA